MTYTFAFKKVDTWIHVYKKLSFWLYFLVGYRGNVTAWNIFNGLYEMRTQICFLGFSSPLRLSSQYTDSVKKPRRGQSNRNFSLNCFLQAGSSLSAGDLQGWHILRRRWLCVRMTGRKLPTPPPAWLGWNSQVCRRQSVLSQPWWGRWCRISTAPKKSGYRTQKIDWNFQDSIGIIFHHFRFRLCPDSRSSGKNKHDSANEWCGFWQFLGPCGFSE